MFAPPPGSDTEAALFAAIAAVVIAVLLFLAPTLDRPGIREVRPIAAALIVLAGALGTGIPIAIVAAAIVIAAVALRGPRARGGPGGWGTAAGIAAVTAFLAGMAAPWLWAVGVLVAVAVPILARAAVRARGSPPSCSSSPRPGVRGGRDDRSARHRGGPRGRASMRGRRLALLQWVALVAIAVRRVG